MRSWIMVCAVAFLTVPVTSLLQAEDPPKKEKPSSTTKKESEEKQGKEGDEKESERPDNLIPLYRFYDHNLNENVYSHDMGEVNAWRKLAHMKEQIIVGDVSPVELPDTTHLWRAFRLPDRKHFHYLRAPGKAVKITVENRVFSCFVWKKPGEGRIPIYATTWTDGTDACFDPDLDNQRKYRENTKKALGAYRLGLHNRDFSIPAFYVYPHVDEKAADPAATEKPKT